MIATRGSLRTALLTSVAIACMGGVALAQEAPGSPEARIAKVAASLAELQEQRADLKAPAAASVGLDLQAVSFRTQYAF